MSSEHSRDENEQRAVGTFVGRALEMIRLRNSGSSPDSSTLCSGRDNAAQLLKQSAPVRDRKRSNMVKELVVDGGRSVVVEG